MELALFRNFPDPLVGEWDTAGRPARRRKVASPFQVEWLTVLGPCRAPLGWAVPVPSPAPALWNLHPMQLAVSPFLRPNVVRWGRGASNLRYPEALRANSLPRPP